MVRAKKSLGQNFLKSKSILNEIIRVADLKSNDTVLEVGPGRGALTEALLRSGCQVIAVEKDDLLFSYLQEKFMSEIKDDLLRLIPGDILELEPGEIFGGQNNSSTWQVDELGYKIVANIPYYITGAFLRKFLGGENPPSRMVLMLQKEVAKRIVAADGKESLLSLSVKVYGKPKYIKKVPARFFAPAPKVDSAILLIEDISRKFFHDNKIEEEKFFELIKAGFAHKRKFLISNLKHLAVQPPSAKGAAPEARLPSRRGGQAGAVALKEKFHLCNISEKARAEDLSLEEWKCLF